MRPDFYVGSPTLQTGAPLEGSYPNYLRSCNNDIEMEVAGAYGGAVSQSQLFSFEQKPMEQRNGVSAIRNLDHELDVAHQHGFGDGEAFRCSPESEKKSNIEKSALFPGTKHVHRVKRRSSGLNSNDYLLNTFEECPAKKRMLDSNDRFGEVYSQNSFDAPMDDQEQSVEMKNEQMFQPSGKISFPPSRMSSELITLTDVDQHNRAIANERFYNFRCINSHLGSHLI
ncbi:uncharacterized protein LOC134845442 isoform X2 [Symsagittifera roscoffensis]|uniref:uncharacterized protein LOC134845442 isoform X2 n=1 Tax=Symsagittifera roscoffensis TaxID=84072 RepID=UPI00307B1F2C